MEPLTLMSVGYESLAWFLSVSGYLQNDNSRSFADILASGGGRGDTPSPRLSRLTGGSLVTARLLSEELRAGEGEAGGWPVGPTTLGIMQN